MRRYAKLAEGHARAIAKDATRATDTTDAMDVTKAWVESNERLFAGLLELNTQAWAGWITFQQTCWQQAQTMFDELPLWMSWQYGTEQLA